MGREGFLQPNHRVDHGVLDARPFGLVALVAAKRDVASNSTGLFLVETLPRQLTTEGSIDHALVLSQSVENALVLLRLSRPAVDVQLDLTLILTDDVVEGQPWHTGMSGGPRPGTADQSFPESLPWTRLLRAVLLVLSLSAFSRLTGLARMKLSGMLHFFESSPSAIFPFGAAISAAAQHDTCCH